MVAVTRESYDNHCAEELDIFSRFAPQAIVDALSTTPAFDCLSVSSQCSHRSKSLTHKTLSCAVQSIPCSTVHLRRLQSLEIWERKIQDRRRCRQTTGPANTELEKV